MRRILFGFPEKLSPVEKLVYKKIIIVVLGIALAMLAAGQLLLDFNLATVWNSGEAIVFWANILGSLACFNLTFAKKPLFILVVLAFAINAINIGNLARANGLVVFKREGIWALSIYVLPIVLLVYRAAAHILSPSNISAERDFQTQKPILQDKDLGYKGFLLALMLVAAFVATMIWILWQENNQ